MDAIGEFSSGPARRIDSLDPGDEFKMAVGRDDLLDVMVDHGGGVDRVPGGDGRICFHQLQGSIGLSESYRKDRKA